MDMFEMLSDGTGAISTQGFVTQAFVQSLPPFVWERLRTQPIEIDFFSINGGDRRFRERASISRYMGSTIYRIEDGQWNHGPSIKMSRIPFTAHFAPVGKVHDLKQGQTWRDFVAWSSPELAAAINCSYYVEENENGVALEAQHLLPIALHTAAQVAADNQKWMHEKIIGPLVDSEICQRICRGQEFTDLLPWSIDPQRKLREQAAKLRYEIPPMRKLGFDVSAWEHDLQTLDTFAVGTGQKGNE